MSVDPATTTHAPTGGGLPLAQMTDEQLGALCALTGSGWSSAEAASVMGLSPETVVEVRAMLGWPDLAALATAARQILHGELDLAAATRGALWLTSSCTWCGAPGEPDDGSGHLISCTQCPLVFAISELRTWCSRCEWWLDGGAGLPAALAHWLEHDLATAATAAHPRSGPQPAAEPPRPEGRS